MKLRTSFHLTPASHTPHPVSHSTNARVVGILFARRQCQCTVVPCSIYGLNLLLLVTYRISEADYLFGPTTPSNPAAYIEVDVVDVHHGSVIIAKEGQFGAVDIYGKGRAPVAEEEEEGV